MKAMRPSLPVSVGVATAALLILIALSSPFFPATAAPTPVPARESGATATAALPQTELPQVRPELTPKDGATATAKLEVEVLRAQLKVMEDSSDRLLQTVHWSLGFALAFLVLLAGFNWFSAKKIHESDVKSIKKDMENSLLAWRAETEAHLRNAAKEQREELSNAVDAAIAKSNRDVQSKVTSIGAALKSLQHDVELLEATGDHRYWEALKVPGNEIRALVSIIVAANKKGYDWKIDNALAEIAKLARAHRANIDPNDVTTMLEFFNRLPQKHALNVEKVKNVFRD